MKKLLLIALPLLFAPKLYAQGDYDNLLEMLVDEKYDKLLYRAEKYTLDDKTKKDPIPYLYLSMAFYEISKRPEDFKEDLTKGAFKNSLKYVVKYRKKDKESVYYAEYQDYFDKLRKGCISEADIYNDQEKFTKSKGYYKYLTGLDKNDPGAWLMKGYTEHKLKSRKDAGLSFGKAKTIVDEMGCDYLTKVQMGLLKSAIITCAEMWDDEGQSDLAKEWLEIGYEYFKDDKEFNVTYEMILG